MSKAPIPAEAREISYESFARAESPTAANAHNRLFPRSGAMDYRVVLGQSGGAMKSVVVNAETGDDAAEMALSRNHGWKVTNVAPAGSEWRDTANYDSVAA